MRHPKKRGVTLIELLVVVAIILILVATGLAVVGDVWRVGYRVQCASNLKQMGIWIVQEALRTGAYPSGGSTPANWDSTWAAMTGPRALGRSEITMCPAADDSPANKPGPPLSTCSYAYMGNLVGALSVYNLGGPVYKCMSTTCDSRCGEAGKVIWKLYWSGVNYTGNHRDGTRDTNLSTFSSTNGYALADNLQWRPEQVDAGEPTIPTIPVHQDTDKFSTNDKVKYRTERALRTLPETPEDRTGNVPLLMDIVILKSLPEGTTIWRNAHLHVTDSNKRNILIAGHCSGSAARKRDWGANILYTNQAVIWKDWAKLRFQVMVPGSNEAGNRYYFF